MSQTDDTSIAYPHLPKEAQVALNCAGKNEIRELIEKIEYNVLRN